ncbi:hypothetical protein N2603_23310 [Bradyrhizobium huanghuaihaiense]|uniref:hypothetical protein n=1 Tax=Bradyrhizobium huanghuaihaiense TaxID=990078 RepID=UPI0021A9C572|nr:hypothetical protein [Bradyrhizobium sp. CB3035]UWU73035.1 hypothetical protein N2603_23310 [Bradyrhizobium sp. CB3035]
MPYDKAALDCYLRARRERSDAAHEMTQRMIARSREALARSEELLRVSMPVVWHPEPPNE